MASENVLSQQTRAMLYSEQQLCGMSDMIWKLRIDGRAYRVEAAGLVAHGPQHDQGVPEANEAVEWDNEAPK
jgi:hypothetical protein